MADYKELPGPEDQKGVSDYVDFALQESSAYRRKKEGPWCEYQKFYNGVQWKNTTEKKPKVNLIFSTIEYEVPILTDNRPGTDIMSSEDERTDDAKVLKEAIDLVYSENDLDIKISQGVRSTLIATNSYLYTDWDPDKNNGEGQVVIKLLPWRYVYLDPSAGEIDDMSYVVIKRPVKVEDLKRIFPMHAEEIKPEEIIDDEGEETDMFLDETRVHPELSRDYQGEYKPQDMAYLIEAWCKDYSVQPIPPEETMEAVQLELESVAQGLIPEVTRFMDHGAIIEQLQMRLQELGVQVQQEQVEKEEAASVGPQIIQEEIGAKIQDGSIPDPESALMAEDALMTQLEEHVMQSSAFDVEIQLLQDTISQHEIQMKNNPEGTKPVYAGNLRLVVKTGNVILYDGPTPVPNGMVPISPLYAYKREGEPYSDGEVKNIIDLQKAFNELFWDEHLGLRLNSNSGWIIDDNSGLDENQIVNQPGMVLKKRAGTEVNRIDPGAVSPQLAQKQMQVKSFIENISGVNEITQGIKPSGVSTYGATQTLLEQSIGRIRLKSRMIEYTMNRLGNIVAAFIIKYWDKRRLLRNYDDGGRIQTLVFDPERLYDLKYQVRMVPGSTLGVSKEAILNQTKELLQGQIISPQAFFKINRGSIPYAQEAIKDIQERDLLMQENAQLKMQLEQLLSTQAVQPANGGMEMPTSGQTVLAS